MTIIVYIAAASAERELARARSAMDTVKASPRLELAHDWVDVIAQAGAANHGLTRAERYRYASEDLHHVRRCDVVWLLVPEAATTRGAWVEVGYALAIGKRLIVSGLYDQSIFCSLGREFRNDASALAFLEAWSKPQGDAGDHYSDHRADSAAWRRELEIAVERQAPADEIRMIEQRLEMALDTGD